MKLIEGAPERGDDFRRTLVDAESITLLVRAFYDDVRADDLLGPIFDAAVGVHWPEHISRLISFWATVTRGARSFSGNVFGKHMAIRGVMPEHFERWLRLWFTRTEALFVATVASTLQTTAVGIGRNLYRGFFAKTISFEEIESRICSGRT